MTSEEFTRSLPPFANNTISLKPPFVFNGLSARVFPMRASLDALQQVCDGYLNQIPKEAGHFRVPAPYVFMMMLDYGQLSQAVARTGWFAQVEVFFLVPVEWYKLVNGHWVFHDWAVITPYIFVDDSFSVPLGRTVYGFPKVLARVTEVKSGWVHNPLAPLTLARVETMVFPEAYAGTRLEMKTFLEIECRPPAPDFQLPFDASSRWAPWTIASNLANAAAGFGRDAMWLAQAMRVFPFSPSVVPGVLQAMMARLIGIADPAGQGMVQNSLNLKQFRLGGDPQHICYQALTNGRMTTRGVNGAGLLGEDRTLLGDLSGGHTIRLFEHSSLPIVRTLGLEVSDHAQGSDVPVAEIKPLMPFWFNVDLTYEQGVSVCWRGEDGIWKNDTGAPFDPSQKPATKANLPDFNSTITTSIEAIAGPFRFSGTTTRVLPLLALKEKLQKFLDGYANDLLSGPGNEIMRDDGKGQEQMRLSVWARPPETVNSGLPIGGRNAYVYLTASSFTSVTSETDNVGEWARYELTFMIPVKWERLVKQPGQAANHWETVGVGMVPAYNFVDDCVAAISRVEIQGIPAATANFVRPESVWLSGEDDKGDFSARPQQTLLRVDAEVFPSFGTGQKTQIKPIVEIQLNDSTGGLGTAPDAAWKWAEQLRLELGTKKAVKANHSEHLKVARALSLELLGNQTPFSIYTLKQFRDIADPDKACSQALMRLPRRIRELQDLREIEDTLVVRIFDYPSLDIVNTLGIYGTQVAAPETGIVFNAQAIRPFFIRADIEEPLSENLISRAGSSRWSLKTEHAFNTLLSDEPGAPVITADYEAETLQDQMDPTRISAIMYQAAQRLRFDDARRAVEGTPAISKQTARNALDAVDPQTVIESALSREWGNSDDNTRWRRGRRTLSHALIGLSAGGDTKAFAESVLYRKMNNTLAETPGAVASALTGIDTYRGDLKTELETLLAKPPEPRAGDRWRDQIQKIIVAQERFTRLRLRMEDGLSMLSSVSILGFHTFGSVVAGLGQTPPDAQEIYAAGRKMVRTIEEISELKIQGEPSERNNLDIVILSNNLRLKELLQEIPADLGVEAGLTWAMDHIEDFRTLVHLARAYCQAQHEALLNKLSRAYQKPDFCVRRDAIGTECPRLLPRSLSWDDDWYYGDKIEYLLGRELPSGVDGAENPVQSQAVSPGPVRSPAMPAAEGRP